MPALERGVIEAFEFNNPTADSQFGAQDVSKHYHMGSYHQAAEFFEIIFNKDRFESLPAEQQAILEYSAEAAQHRQLRPRDGPLLRGLAEAHQRGRRERVPHGLLHPGGPARFMGRGAREAHVRLLLRQGGGEPERHGPHRVAFSTISTTRPTTSSPSSTTSPANSRSDPGSPRGRGTVRRGGRAPSAPPLARRSGRPDGHGGPSGR